MQKTSHTLLPLLGRFLISLIFIVAGLGKIVDFSGSVATLKYLGIQESELYIIIAIIMEILGGSMLLLGWKTRWGSILLMVVLLPITLLFHHFWTFSGEDLSLQLSLFLKNLAIYGGLLLLLHYGPGRWSIDALLQEEEIS